MVEGHVGKRRLKEVRQAIKMKKELRSSLLVILFILVFGIVAATAMTYLLVTGAVPNDNPMSQCIPLIVIIVVLIFLIPRAKKWRERYDEYTEHLVRYNISKDDMDALQQSES